MAQKVMVRRFITILLFACLLIFHYHGVLAKTGPHQIVVETPPGDSELLGVEGEPDEAVRHINLKECIGIARQNSVEIKNAHLDLEISKLKTKSAEVAYRPQVSAGFDYVLDDKASNLSNSNRYEAYISLSAGKLNSTENFIVLKEAMSSAATAELGINKKENLLTFSITERYFNLLYAQKHLELQLAMIRKIRRNYKETKRKHDSGHASEVEVLQAGASYSTHQLNLQLKKNALDYAAMQLSSAIGLNSSTKLRALSIIKVDLFTTDWEQCLETGTKNNRKLKIYQKTLEQMKDLYKLAKRARWPMLSLEGFIGEPHNYGDLYDEDANYGIKLTLSQVLFDSGIIKRRIKEFGLEIQKQEKILQNLKKRFVDSLRLHYDSLNNCAKALKLSKKRRDLARQLADMMQRSYSMGVISLKQKLDSDSTAEGAEIDYTTALCNYLLAEYRLKMQMGLNLFDIADDMSGDPAQ
jgi:outer membrane protein TolC